MKAAAEKAAAEQAAAEQAAAEKAAAEKAAAEKAAAEQAAAEKAAAEKAAAEKAAAEQAAEAERAKQEEMVQEALKQVAQEKAEAEARIAAAEAATAAAQAAAQQALRVSANEKAEAEARVAAAEAATAAAQAAAAAPAVASQRAWLSEQESMSHMKITFSSTEPLGMTVGARGNEVVVTEVEPDGQAAKLPAGALITEVEGTSCVGKTKTEVLKIVKAMRADGKQVTLTFDASKGSLNTSGPRRSSSSVTPTPLARSSSSVTPKSPRTPQGPQVEKKVTFAANAPLGITLQQQAGKVVVTTVDPMGPAQKERIPVGAVVKAVNDDSLPSELGPGGKDQVLAMIKKGKKKGVVVQMTFAYHQR